MKLSVVCAACQKTQLAKPAKGGGLKMPRGKGGFWKQRGELTYCPACVKSLWSLRALTLPARGLPLEGGTLDQLWAGLRLAWDQCVQLGNWLTTELARHDRFRRPGEALAGKDFKKAAPFPNVWPTRGPDSLYSRAAALFPDLPTQSVTSMLQSIRGKYSAKRYDILWSFKSSIPTCRRAPLSLSNQAWRAEWREVQEEAETGARTVRAPVISFRLAGCRWAVRLRFGSGEHARRATEAFDELTRMPESMRGELAIYRKKSSAGAHRSTRPEKEPGGGNEKHCRLMFKLVARFTRAERTERARRGTLEVHTARNCLFVASMSGWEEPWLLHADALRGLVHANRKKNQRLSDDQKAERRRPRRRRLGIQGYRDKIAANYANALKSRIEYVCAQLTGLADRCKAATIRYDDRSRKFCPELAWAQLRDALQRQANRLGIAVEYVSASGEVVYETTGTARGVD